VSDEKGRGLKKEGPADGSKEQGRDQQKESSQIKLGVGETVEVLKDRFDRPWYGVRRSLVDAANSQESASTERPEVKRATLNSVAAVKGAGERSAAEADRPVGLSEEPEPLITWEQSQELGIPAVAQETMIPSSLDEEALIPVEELTEQE